MGCYRTTWALLKSRRWCSLAEDDLRACKCFSIPTRGAGAGAPLRLSDLVRINRHAETTMVSNHSGFKAARNRSACSSLASLEQDNSAAGDEMLLCRASVCGLKHQRDVRFSSTLN